MAVDHDKCDCHVAGDHESGEAGEQSEDNEKAAEKFSER